jgi:hypothetical protein
MSIDNALLEELSELVVVCANGAASDEQFMRLERLLDTSEEARNFYVDSLDMHASLYGYCRQHQETIEDGMDDARFRADEIVGDRPSDSEFAIPPSAISDRASVPPSPLPSILGNAIHGTVGYFSSGWPVAYLVATAILGVGLLVGAFVHVSTPVQIVQQATPAPSPSSTTHYPLPATHSNVGRITGMVDCQWETEGLGIGDWGLEGPRFKVQGSRGNQSPIPNPQSLVSLGDKFALSSGLMEITYNTGAKVILQGPCTYEVESLASGFLSVGKLTARVENRVVSSQLSVVSKSEIRNQKSETSNPQSLIPNPLFFVRTPTATVTDLGTEFGVDVQPDHRQSVVVFQGQVQVALASRGNTPQNKGVLLTQGQSVHIEPGTKLPLMPDSYTLASHAFVRQLPQPTAKLPSILNPSFEEKGFGDEAPPQSWRYWVVEGDGRAPRVSSDIGGMAPTAAGDYMFQIICCNSSTIEAWQATNAHFVPGQRYDLTVAVGMRNDLRNADCAAEADWKISLNYAGAGKEVAGLCGTILNDSTHTGFLQDQTLTYTATPADAKHGIEIRLVASTVGKSPFQTGGATMICMNFDNVRLNVATATESKSSGQPINDAGQQPLAPQDSHP